MAFGVNNILYGFSQSAVSAQVTGSALDFRAANGNFAFQFNASGTNAGFGNSAHITVDHSLDNVNWAVLATITASGTAGVAVTFFTAGTVAYVRSTTLRVYSGATGTGVVNGLFFANNQGG